MKLLAKYNRVNILATVLVLLVSGVGYYFILKFVLLNQLDKDLKLEEQEVKDYIKLNNNLPNAANYKDQKIAYGQTNETIVKRKIKSIDVFNTDENETTPSRQLEFYNNRSR
ncbi:MAG: hypothetical protein WDM90_02910 [Ferruginibacter sp.]